MNWAVYADQRMKSGSQTVQAMKKINTVQIAVFVSAMNAIRIDQAGALRSAWEGELGPERFERPVLQKIRVL